MCSINCSGGCPECAPDEHADCTKWSGCYGCYPDESRFVFGIAHTAWLKAIKIAEEMEAYDVARRLRLTIMMDDVYNEINKIHPVLLQNIGKDYGCET